MGSLTTRKTTRTQYCRDNLQFWRTPEGGDLDFTQMGKLCNLDKSTVITIAREIEEKEGLPKYSLTKNQKMSEGIRRANAKKKEENNMGRKKNVETVTVAMEEKPMKKEEMSNSQKKKILKEAKEAGLHYEDVAVKLGVETSEEVDLIIHAVIVKPDEMEEYKEAFGAASKTTSIEAASQLAALAEDIGDLNEKNAGAYILRLIDQGTGLREQVDDTDEDYKQFKTTVKKEISTINKKTLQFEKEVQKLKDEFEQKLNKLVEENTSWIFTRLTSLEQENEPKFELITQNVESLKKHVDEYIFEYRDFYEAWKRIRKTTILVDLATGTFIAPEGKEDLVVHDMDNEIYHEIMDDDNPIFDLDRRSLKIVAQARAIVINATTKVDFVDKDGNPLPEDILRAIEA